MKTKLSHDYNALHLPMTERLVDLGRSLTPEQWQSPSLCTGWRVCDVYGHMTYGAVTPLPKVIPMLLFKHRGNLNRGSAIESVRYADSHDQATVMAEFERSSHHPVGIATKIKPFELYVDHVVHELDIRRPLGLASTWSIDELHAALDAAVIVKNPLLSPSKNAKHLRFTATDLHWSFGENDAEEVTGPAEDLLLAICGRPLGLRPLTGPGIGELTRRIG